jgi:hypothetical protein
VVTSMGLAADDSGDDSGDDAFPERPLTRGTR